MDESTLLCLGTRTSAALGRLSEWQMLRRRKPLSSDQARRGNDAREMTYGAMQTFQVSSTPTPPFNTRQPEGLRGASTLVPMPPRPEGMLTFGLRPSLSYENDFKRVRGRE